MSVETDLVSAFIGDAGVSALIGDRMYHVEIPGAATFPAVRYNVISRRVLGGTCYWARVQTSAFAESYSDLKDLRDAIQTLTESKLNWRYFEGSESYENDEGLYHQPIDLIIT